MAVSEHVMLLGQFLHSNGIALGGTAWKKQPVKKGIGTRRGIPWHSSNSGQHLPASHWICASPSLHLTTFDSPS